MIRHILAEGFALLRRRMLASLALIVAVAMPVALGGVTLSIDLWLKPILRGTVSGGTVEVLLRPGKDEGVIESWVTGQRTKHPAWRLRHIPKAEIQKRLSTWFPYLKPLLRDRPSNLLPDIVEITSPHPHSVTQLAGDPLVLAVGPETSFGPELRHFALRVSWLIGVATAVLLFSSALFAGIWVHLELFRHADEIAIMRLVGATETSIQGPFLFAIGVTGALAGILASLLDAAMLRWLSTLLQSIGLPPLEGPAAVIVLQLLIATLIPLGIATWTLARHATLEIED